MYVYIFWSTTESTKIFQKTFQTFLLWSQTFDISMFKEMCLPCQFGHFFFEKIQTWLFFKLFCLWLCFDSKKMLLNVTKETNVVSEFSTLLFHVKLL